MEGERRGERKPQLPQENRNNRQVLDWTQKMEERTESHLSPRIFTRTLGNTLLEQHLSPGLSDTSVLCPSLPNSEVI